MASKGKKSSVVPIHSGLATTSGSSATMDLADQMGALPPQDLMDDNEEDDMEDTKPGGLDDDEDSDTNKKDRSSKITTRCGVKCG